MFGLSKNERIEHLETKVTALIDMLDKLQFVVAGVMEREQQAIDKQLEK